MDAIFSAFLAVTIGTYFGLVFSWLLFVLLPQVSENIASELSSSGSSEVIREVEELQGVRKRIWEGGGPKVHRWDMAISRSSLTFISYMYVHSLIYVLFDYS